MKLGELKIQALMLIFPSADLEYDHKNLDEVIFVLKAHPNFGPYIKSSIGAINRALSIIEAGSNTTYTRITHTTPDSTELEINERIAQIIPYFIKSDLLLSESPSEANEARKIFDKLLARVQVEVENVTTSTVFCWGELFK
jgi:hypothetical protein